MSDRGATLTLRVLAALAVVSALTAVIFVSAEELSDVLLSEGGPFLAFAVFFGILVWLVAPRQPRNAVVWIMAIAAFFTGTYMSAFLAASLMVSDPQVLFDEAIIPAELPTAAAWLLFLVLGPATGALIGMVTLGFLLFPDGHLPSRGWRWVTVLSGAVIAAVTVQIAREYYPGNTLPAYSRTPAWIGGLMFAALVLSLAGLAAKFRVSSGETRQQFKWVFWGAAILTLSLIGILVLEGTDSADAALAVFAVAAFVFVTSYGIAVGRYRLYDIDVVISRTFVYGTLAVFITGVYVFAVVGIGSLLGTEAGESPWLPIGATALVAFAFEPLRARLQRLANRLVYGKRATPYEVLSDFSRRLTSTDENLLPQVARTLAEGTTARAAGVWLQRNGSLERVAVWPEDQETGETGEATGQSDPEFTLPVVHDGESLGALTLSAARGQTLLPSDERLLEQMAAGMGLALRNIRLSEDLRQDVEKLRLSRQRLLTAQDETRRHLERQLHDGAQQRLVALKLKLALTKGKAEISAVPDVALLLEEAASETDQTVESLRDFARGIYPPLLESEGLGAALASQVPKLPIAVTVHTQGVGRHSRALEAAIYFSILEALQNVVKHANAGSAHVALRSGNGVLTFEVSDDGRGFDPDAVDAGSGLANLADRLDTLDGTLEVTSSPGAGTTVLGRVPVQEKGAVQ